MSNQPYSLIQRRSTSDIINQQDGFKTISPTSPRESFSDVNDNTIKFPEGSVGSYIVLAYEATTGLSPIIAIITQLSTILKILNTYVSTPEVSPLANSWIITTYLFTFFTSTILAGDFSDNFTTIVPIATGSIILVVSCFFCIFTRSWVGYLFNVGVLMGLGSGIVYIPCMLSVAHFFKKTRGWAIGLVISLGGCCASWFVNTLLESVQDVDSLTSIMFVFTGIWLSLGFLACVFNLTRTLGDGGFKYRNTVLERPDQRKDETIEPKSILYPHIDWELAKNVKFMKKVIVNGVGFGILFITSSFLPIFVASKASTEEEAYFISISSILFGLFSSTFLGYVADCIGVLKLQIALYTTTSLIWILLPLTNHAYVLYAYLGLLTTCAFSPILTSSLSIGELTNCTIELGSSLSTSLFFSSFPAIITLRIAYALLGFEEQSFTTLKFGVLTTGASIVALVFTLEGRDRNEGSKN